MNAPDPDPAARPGTAVDAPTTLRWAVRLLFAEAAALVLVTAFLIFQDFTADATDLAVALALTGFAAVSAVAVLAVGRGLARRAAGARGPAIVIQLMLVVLAYYMIRGGVPWFGVPLLALGLTVAVLTVLPPTTRALGLD